MSALPLNRILIGDVRERLHELPDASVDCIITSPPYFALRNYGHDDQLGAEPNVDAWAARIAAVCNDLARVLTPTGALWLNLGDGYSRHPREGTSKKSLLLGPQRVALRLTLDRSQFCGHLGCRLPLIAAEVARGDTPSFYPGVQGSGR